MSRRALDPRVITTMAVMSALVFVLTRVVQVPTPVVGYIHLGDVGVFFSALAFGPWVGAVAGGLGTALADLTSPYAQWAIFSLVIHGLQGWVTGKLSLRWKGSRGLLFAMGIGSAIVVVGYLLAGSLLVGFGAALTEVPLNLVQVLTGALGSWPLFIAVRRAYPPILRWGQRER